MPIQSFRCADTQGLFGGRRVKRFIRIESAAMRKLAMLHRAGQHSIRVNDQFRVCFVWTADGPKDVEIVDCH